MEVMILGLFILGCCLPYYVCDYRPRRRARKQTRLAKYPVENWTQADWEELFRTVSDINDRRGGGP